MITILYFAGLKDITGCEMEEIHWSNKSVSELVQTLQQKYIKFPNGPFHIAVNEEYVPLNYHIQTGDHIAIIPPVSGG